MNHEHFKKCIGQSLRLEPQALGPDGRHVDDAWEVSVIDDGRTAVTLRNRTRGGEVVVSFDAVKNYDEDPGSGESCGFLNMLWQVRIAGDGTINARPIPARPAAPPPPEFRPLVVNDGQEGRHLSWESRDAALVQLAEGQARQLYGSFIQVCDALRLDSGREPQFDAPNGIRHEVVWELTPDHRSKHKLLGGMNGAHAMQVLVLTHNRAQARPEPVANVAAPENEAVDLDFPARSGLQAEQEAEGFRLRWVREEQVARRREQGWESVVVARDGRRVSFKVPPAMPSVDPAALVLMRHRN